MSGENKDSWCRLWTLRVHGRCVFFDLLAFMLLTRIIIDVMRLFWDVETMTRLDRSMGRVERRKCDVLVRGESSKYRRA